jgi:uncharacterized protein (DUF1499 family)
MREPNAALFSSWTPRVALFSGALVCTAILLHRLLGMPTPLALNLFTVAFALAALALVLGFVALVDVWRRGRSGFAWSMLGLLVAAGIFAWPASFLPAYFNQPAINDVTTDLASPPKFAALAKLRGRGANPPEYPQQRFVELQKATHPDLRPLYVGRSLEDAYEIALETIRRMRYQIVAEEAPGPRKPGVIEAIDRTAVIGFYDDVVLRVSSDQGRSRIDVRSSSRYGEHDLGRNAYRIRRLLTELQARSDASIAGPGLRFQRIKARLEQAKQLAKRSKAGDQKTLDRRKGPGAAPSDALRGPVPKVKQPARAGGRSLDKQD